MILNKTDFLLELRTHHYKTEITVKSYNYKIKFLFPNKNTRTSRHDFITVYFLLDEKKKKVLTRLRYRKKDGLSVTQWKEYLTRKSKIPMALNLFVAGYNEKHDTQYKLDKIFLVKFS